MTTIVAALIVGVTAALLLALTPPPAQAQSGDVLRLLSIKAVDITNDEGPFDPFDEPYIRVDGVEVWSGRSEALRMRNGDVRNLVGLTATLSGQSARVQLLEFDGGPLQGGDDEAEFFADFTGGDERTRTLSLNGGVYELTYKVERPDVTPPDTIISGGPEGPISVDRAAFEFFANEPASFQCKLDSGVFEPCSSPKVYSGLGLGDHSFSVRAIDGAGNVDATPDVRQFSVVRDPLPTISSLRPAPGSSTRDRTPLIQATIKDVPSELGQADITLALDGRAKSFAYNATTDRLLYQSGRLAYGKHRVDVTATDDAGQKATRVWTFKVVRP